MDEIKRNLKDARNHIEKKDFENATKLIKNVLKQDKNNYMALVLLGVALQDEEKAPLAFKKAISVNTDKPLAWQGLASYYERNNLFCEDLMEAYLMLSSLENDIKKYSEICMKIMESFKMANECLKYSKLFYKHTKELKDEEKREVCSKTLASIVINSMLSYDASSFDFLTEVFEFLKHTKNHELNELFFDHVIINKGFDYFENEYGLYVRSNLTDNLKDIVLKHFINEYIKDDMFYNHNEKRYKFINSITENGKHSVYFTLTESLLLFDNGDYYDAYVKIINLSCNEDMKYIHQIIIGSICLKLGRWKEAENLSRSVRNETKDSVLRRRSSKILLICLCSQNNEEKCKKGLQLLDQLEDDKDHHEIKALFLAYCYLKDFNNCEKCLTLLQNTSNYNVLKCLIVKAKNGFDKSYIDCLNENKQSPFSWFFVGEYYMEVGEYDKALIPLLQAARLEKHDSSVLTYLGDYYSLYEKNFDKAKKCYLKAFTVNPECHKAGKSLSNTYRNLKDWKANYEFLKELSSSQNNNSFWTWLELGLHHFALEEWDAAIVNLRTYVRLCPSDIEAWESLADAYYSRGSFTSALKCYQKSIELNPRKYSIVQVGAVQCLLGEHRAALNTFNSVNDDIFLPALKGLSDVYLAIANDKLNHNLYANCRDNVQKSVDFVAKAILNDNQYVCLWTNLSAAISIVTKLPDKYRWLQIEPKIWENQQEPGGLLRNGNLFLLQIQCLCRAINLSKQMNVSLYYELATAYLDYYKTHGDVSAVQKAFITIKYCISAEKSNWQFWNLLGVICMSKNIKKYSLGQHAFLKAVGLEYCNAMVWSNLGIIYLFFGNILLSNKAFQKAQQFDPLYMQSWIGHALIAESIDHDDAMGLFLHSSQLGFHRESCLGYTEYVCNNLVNKDNKTVSRVEYSLKNMHAIPTAYDLMTWLVEYESSDPHCLNLIGILQEKMGLLQSSIESYEKALQTVDENYKDSLLTNYGRVLYLSERWEEAAKVFKTLKEENMVSCCGLALCLHKLGKYEEAYTLYGTVFQWLANDDFEKAQLLITLASMSYKNNDTENSKTLIYQCVEQESLYVCVPVVLAGYGLSVLTADKHLSQAIMYDLQKMNNNNKYSQLLALFDAYNSLKYESISKAVYKFQHYIHMYPSQFKLWQYLSSVCASDMYNPSVASICAQKVIALDVSNEDLVKSYRIAGIAEVRLGNTKKAMKFAQKAVHLFPNKTSNWLLLIYIRVLHTAPDYSKQWIRDVFEYVRPYLLCEPQKNWLKSTERHLKLVT